MSGKNLIRFTHSWLEPYALFNLKVNTSFTIPETRVQLSPVHPDMGGDILKSVVNTSGGQMLVATSDGAAGTASVFDLTSTGACDLFPGDIVAMSAVASGNVTLTITSKDGTIRSYVFPTTTTASAVGYYC